MEIADEAWKRFAKLFFQSVIAGLIVSAVLIAVANPYGNLPHLLFREHIIVDINQRYQYPAVVRSGRFDSAVFGSSTSRLLPPESLNAIFGGHFANLAMNAATPWEQYQLASLFARTVKKPETLVIGLDRTWCRATADDQQVTKRGFPDWMYDNNNFNDWLYMFNVKAIELSIRRLRYALGFAKARLPVDGYRVFMGPDKYYDPGRANENLKDHPEPVEAAPESEVRARWSFPALYWLGELLHGPWNRKILVFPAVHMSAQAFPQSREFWRFEECKSRIKALALSHRASVVNFQISSSITRDNSNYWDPLHYREAIADRVVTGLGEALQTGQSDPNGDWEMVVAPTAE